MIFPPPEASNINPDCLSTIELWKMEPNNESISVPIVPMIVKKTKFQNLLSLKVKDAIKLINDDPKIPAINPTLETPPFVPGGTGLKVVINIGDDLDRIPNSEDHVSDITVAYCAIIPALNNDRILSSNVKIDEITNILATIELAST
ncbi:hypothetical protein WICMUC_002068 [Wickerhamomyces mucosus]|uniref:Uncharacterized protein n=1 Tax=Wickerhamomyces mucosus TaxID=1378264 RepID=A0A9P8PRU1_9ASCO|nr:hypothetical protein WICMUC_002068 [Wickerhamomyces mucosus]